MAGIQRNEEPIVPPHFTFSPAFEFLRTTHSNFFNGPSFKVNYNPTSRFKPGVGIEYASSAIHHDNGYVLYKVKIVPVYANIKYEISQNKKITPYVEASAGISFVKYVEAEDESPTKTTLIKESGMYLYAGTGIKYAISNKFKPFLGFGFKGFHNSLNDLDINPHGLTFHMGFSL